ncbi:MAG: TatD family hydrolase [Bdellovibrio bacteriovorus]
MELIDTHCHLDVAEFDPDRDAVLARARAAGVVAVVIPAIHRAGWPWLLQYCASQPGLHPALGLHPVYLDAHGADDVRALESAIAERRPLAVGEIGLDYFVRDLDRKRQQDLFESQLAIARAADLPVLLHVRRAHEQALATLRRARVRGGIAHAFSGGIEEARRYLDLGFKLGFGGMLTFERSNRLRRLAAALPVESLVLETDAPDLTVAAHRGGRNSPEYLPDVLAALAEVRQADPAELAAITTTNARAVLGLPRGEAWTGAGAA